MPGGTMYKEGQSPSRDGDEMLKDIADAFGLMVDALEPLHDDDLVSNAEPCRSCEQWARNYAELEAELAECRSDLEMHRAQIEALLQSIPQEGP